MPFDVKIYIHFSCGNCKQIVCKCTFCCYCCASRVYCISFGRDSQTKFYTLCNEAWSTSIICLARLTSTDHFLVPKYFFLLAPSSYFTDNQFWSKIFVLIPHEFKSNQYYRTFFSRVRSEKKEARNFELKQEKKTPQNEILINFAEIISYLSTNPVLNI